MSIGIIGIGTFTIGGTASAGIAPATEGLMSWQTGIAADESTERCRTPCKEPHIAVTSRSENLMSKSRLSVGACVLALDSVAPAFAQTQQAAPAIIAGFVIT